MIKLIFLFSFFLTSLIIPSYSNTYLISLTSLINKSYKNNNFLINYGGGGSGGGGGNSPKAKAKRSARQEKVKLLFKKRKALKKLAEGIPLTKEEKRILGIDQI